MYAERTELMPANLEKQVAPEPEDRFRKQLHSGFLLTSVLVFLVSIIVLPSLAVAGESMDEVLRMAPGDQQVLTFPKRMTKVATSDPAVTAVAVSASRELLLTAKAEGSSIVSVWLKGMEQPLRSTVVIADTAGNALPFGTQVQTDIRILEVSRSELNSFGFQYSNIFDGGNTTVGVSTPGGAVQASGDSFSLFRLGRNSTTIINALESGGFAYTLAEPSLTALSGQTASFLSGGEFPVPTQSNTNGVQIEFKSFGVGLALTPTVIDENQIILKVAPEVSELDFTAGVTTGGVSVPGLRVRRSETTVSMAPGETFIISGLVSRNTVNNSDRIPGLGNLPVLGAFFRSGRIEREDKELVMVVTPHLVSPKSAAMPRDPLPGAGYHNSSTGWLDMMTETRPGSQSIRHGLSW
ncbi:pilus assembly protein N-terminal domain-containing protein [uncultured Alcanivorax sp.]|jgi:pilus assembly protein CpaC|uniref:type II and III secretion system protein family protein n=1 Tax=uncultured Alcanivorax sp. TaxID=191215 RepID=UPI0025833864|nr:pilus assembly protein N-terminal domain-containing protein [uncultured Alcanivorax sp.]